MQSIIKLNKNIISRQPRRSVLALLVSSAALSAASQAFGSGDAPAAEPAASAPAAAVQAEQGTPAKAKPLSDPQAALAQVQALADGKKYKEAEKKAREFLSQDPAQAEIQNLLGFSLRKQKKFQESLEAYQEALKLKPDFAQAKEYLAISYLNMKEVKPAVALYNELKVSNPELAKLVEGEAKRLKIKLK